MPRRVDRAVDRTTEEYGSNLPEEFQQAPDGQEKSGKDSKAKEQERLSTKFLQAADRFNIVRGIAVTMGRFLKFLGIEFTVAAVIRQSQVSTNLISNIFRLLGVVADTLLLPFLPLLGPLAQFVTTKVVPFIQNRLMPQVQKIANFVENLLNFFFEIVATFGPFFEQLLTGIGNILDWLTKTYENARKGWEGLQSSLAIFIASIVGFRLLFRTFTALYRRAKGIENAQDEKNFSIMHKHQMETNLLLREQILVTKGAAASTPAAGTAGRFGALSVLGFGGGILPILGLSAISAALFGIFSSSRNQSSSAPVPQTGAGGRDISADINLRFINQGDGERHYQVDNVLNRNDHTRFAVSLGDAR